MTAQTDQNKQTAMAFYDLMFNQCQPAEAIENGHSVNARRRVGGTTEDNG